MEQFEYSPSGELPEERRQSDQAERDAFEAMSDKERLLHEMSERIKDLEPRAASGDEAAARKIRTIQANMDIARGN